MTRGVNHKGTSKGGDGGSQYTFSLQNNEELSGDGGTLLVKKKNSRTFVFTRKGRRNEQGDQRIPERDTNVKIMKIQVMDC